LIRKPDATAFDKGELSAFRMDAGSATEEEKKKNCGGRAPTLPRRTTRSEEYDSRRDSRLGSLASEASGNTAKQTFFEAVEPRSPQWKL